MTTGLLAVAMFICILYAFLEFFMGPSKALAPLLFGAFVFGFGFVHSIG